MLSAVWSLGRSLRGEGYDLGIDVRGDILSVFVMTLAGIPRRVGWAMGGGGFLLTDVAEWVRGRHEVNSRLALLDTLSIPVDGPARVRVFVSDSDRVEVARRLRDAWPEPGSTSCLTSSGIAVRSQAPSDWTTTEIHGWDEPDWLQAGRFGGSTPLLAVRLKEAGTAASRWPPEHWRILIGRFLADGWRVAVVCGRDIDVDHDR